MFDHLIDDTIGGTAKAIGASDDAQFTVDIADLLDETAYGPFNLHAHGLNVPDDDSYTATMSIFDPQDIGELYISNKAAPGNCHVDDLTGKHGSKTTTEGSFITSFVDNFLSTEKESTIFWQPRFCTVNRQYHEDSVHKLRRPRYYCRWHQQQCHGW